jgi:murein L,D-transpeptidase YcbB/YkuD
MLASAAFAALTVVCAPAYGAASPEITMSSPAAFSANQAVDAFYASRHGAPLWLRAGPESSAARELIGILDRAPLDGLDSGPAIAAEARTLVARAQTGDPAALASADRLLSTAWVLYVQALQRPPSGVVYADSWVRPRQQSAMQILTQAAGASSLPAYVRKVSEVNPLYAQLRDTAWTQMQQNGGQIDPRVLTSLDRVREHPFQDRYIIVDTAAARLYMIDNGQIAGSMKVIVGKADPGTQTPLLASTIYYATLNPYWHVSPDLVRSLIAKNVLEQGLGYLKLHGYQVMPADPNDDTLLDPAKVDWQAVADGQLQVRVRELPGPGNSMGHIKFGFPNKYDIYLHDTPVKSLFAQDDRDLSHGCIRLQDAERLGAWMLGHEPKADSHDPELNVPLPTPVPIYVTYLTAQANDGQLSYVDDIYGLDRAAEVAALR